MRRRARDAPAALGGDHLHSLGVIHRDLKPENLLLASKAAGADIKIADFGHTKRVGLGGGVAGDDATTPCGSLGYAAPEQLSLRRYEREVDLWACGVIAYVLLSGTMPFDPSKYEDHLAAEPFVVRLPDEHWAGVSADARDFVLRLLQLDPDKRPRAREALAHPWLQQGGGGAAVASPRLPTPTRLQQLQQSGLLHHHFAHAAEVWHFACSADAAAADGGQWPVAAAPAAAAAANEVPLRTTTTCRCCCRRRRRDGRARTRRARARATRRGSGRRRRVKDKFCLSNCSRARI